MFLSRFQINVRRREARLLLSSAHRMHGAVMAAFPPDQRQAERGRILWRLDESPHETVLYVVSPYEPDFAHLAESVGWSTSNREVHDYSPVLDRLGIRQRYAFRLTANPTFARKVDPVARSQRIAHVTVDQQTAWFFKQAKQHGFAAAETESKEPDVAVRRRNTLKFTREQRTVTIATATFEGILEVTNPEQLRSALVNGIGPAKGYGCGLLTLAKPR